MVMSRATIENARGKKWTPTPAAATETAASRIQNAGRLTGTPCECGPAILCRQGTPSTAGLPYESVIDCQLCNRIWSRESGRPKKHSELLIFCEVVIDGDRNGSCSG